MDDATQRLVDEARESLDQAERFCKATKRKPGQPPTVRVIADLATSLRSAIRALEAAQRPPVSPEAREALSALAKDVFYATRDEGGTMHQAADRLADRTLARFSFPSQPVYDEEKIVALVRGAIGYAPAPLSIRDHPEIRFEHRTAADADGLVERITAALVAALRSGELTREETTP